MNLESTLTWPLSCPKDGVHLSRRRPVEIGSGGLCDFLPTSQMRDGLQGSTVVKAAGVEPEPRDLLS